MRPRRKDLWKEYKGSLAVAYLFALVFVFIMPGTIMSRIEVACLSGFVFGTLFFAVGYFLPKAKFRSFWLTCVVRSLILCAVMAIGMTFVIPFAISLDPRSKGAAMWSPEVMRTFASIGVGIMLPWC